MKPLALLLSLLASSTAFAHVTLETREAVADSTYKAVLRLPHGCAGSATTGIRVILPDGFRMAKPMPKAGWQLTTVKKAVTPFDHHGAPVKEDVSEIVWQGGKLRDDFYDEFVFRGRLPDRAGETVWFKVIQRCEKGETRWVQIPASGEKTDYPATGVKLLPSAAPLHQH